MQIQLSDEEIRHAAIYYLFTLQGLEFAEFIASQVKGRDHCETIPLIRHFKALEKSMDEDELQMRGDLSAKLLECNEL